MSTSLQEEYEEDLGYDQDVLNPQLPEEELCDLDDLDNYHAPIFTDLEAMMAAGYEQPAGIVTERTPGLGIRETPTAGPSLNAPEAHTDNSSSEPIKVKEEPREDVQLSDLMNIPSLVGSGTAENPFVLDDEEVDVVAETMDHDMGEADTTTQDTDEETRRTAPPAGTNSGVSGTSTVAALDLGQSMLKTPSKTGKFGATDITDKVLQAQQALKARKAAEKNGEKGLVDGQGGATVIQSRAEPPGTNGRGIIMQDVAELNEKTAAEFAAAKKAYDRKVKAKKNTMEDDIAFIRLQSAEDDRRRRLDQEREAELTDRGTGAEPMDQEREADLMDDPLFEPNGGQDVMPSATAPHAMHRDGDVDMDDGTDPIEDPGVGVSTVKRRKPAVPRKRTKYKIPKNVEWESMEVALDEELYGGVKKKGKNVKIAESSKKPGRGRPKGSPNKNKDPKFKVTKKTSNAASRNKASPNKKSKQPNLLDMPSLITGNVVRDAAGNELRPAQPTFTKTRKDEALKQLIASLPSDAVLRTAQMDKNYLLSATKDFLGHGSVKADGTGGWIVKGMKSALKHYQLLGAAFFRRRERGDDQPRGGMSADAMGFGKTVMMLANIINGRPSEDQYPRATLIVATPALASQWFDEIKKHCKKEAIGEVLKHYGKNKLATNDTAESLQRFDIIITTYTEVMRSYPKAEVPLHLQTAAEKHAWWSDYRKKHQGVLHDVHFHRVVLDEAQAIKNYKSYTSIACRALMGEHKWALSGTPIQNRTEELYPYFKFLRVPNTGSLRVFKQNFCGNDTIKIQRLAMFLSKFMIRRTHLDRLFGAPLVQLPKTSEHMHLCHFNDLERSVYEIVRRRMILRINMMSRRNELERNYQNVLTMILRLRQLTGSILNIELVMRDILEREDHEKLAELAEAEAEARTVDTRRAQLVQLRKVLSAHANDGASNAQAEAQGNAAAHDQTEEPVPGPSGAATPSGVADSHPSGNENTLDVGGSFGLKFDFRAYLQSLRQGNKWEELQQRTLCCSCGDIPTNPWVTSCYHIYCNTCLEELQNNAAQCGHDHARCLDCGDMFHNCKPCDDFNLATGTPKIGSSSSPEPESRRRRRGGRNKDPEEGVMKDWIQMEGDDFLPSAKTIAIKAQILEWFKENPSVKIIIYTQFISMIRILSRVCKIEKWGYETYYGGRTHEAREKALEVFNEDPDCRILIAGLRVGGIGLNLTMASKVIIVDPWWNSAVEQQALCRVYRIGQTSETCMVRFVVKNTVDERLIRIQERKKKEIDTIMESDGSARRKLTIKELLKLFGPVEEEEDGEGHRQFVIVEDVHHDPMVGADSDDEGLGDEP